MIPATLNAAEKQSVVYCIPTWLRDEQIRQAIAKVKGRIAPTTVMRDDKIAIVCYGPSLNDTWEELRNFRYIMTCSGAHKFLVDRGIIPTWHLDVDPRQHKVELMGQPQIETEYLMASACHPKMFEHLDGYNVKLWHIFDSAEEGFRLLPEGEWALTGGCGAGLRAMTMARFLGFTDLHVFGMDGSEGKTGKHAAAHPSQAKKHSLTVCNGKDFYTTPAFLEAARQTFSELDKMPDVRATFYGEGLVQEMAKSYVPHPIKSANIAFNKPELISAEYRELNAKLHQDNLMYGVGAGRHAPVILKLVTSVKAQSILDYGCGKGYLAKALDFPIWEYDPAIPGKQGSPRPADIVACLDVLEHIEPDKLTYVLGDLARCVKKAGYFVINIGPAKKTYANGRNTHLIQRDGVWWKKQVKQFFTVNETFNLEKEVHFVVTPKVKTLSDKWSWKNAVFMNDPYPVGYVSDVLDPAFYKELAKTFPDTGLFKKFNKQNKKLSLSELNNPKAYAKFIAETPIWKAFHSYVKRPEFITEVRKFLDGNGVHLADNDYKTRFEFSLMPADGGCIRPHTDISSKVVTLVIGIPDKNDTWDQSWGGGTDVLLPNGDVSGQDYKAEFSEFTVAKTIPYIANQCLVFVKTDDSWHAVTPMTGPATTFRRTVTVNIEKV